MDCLFHNHECLFPESKGCGGCICFFEREKHICGYMIECLSAEVQSEFSEFSSSDLPEDEF